MHFHRPAFAVFNTTPTNFRRITTDERLLVLGDTNLDDFYNFKI